MLTKSLWHLSDSKSAIIQQEQATSQEGMLTIKSRYSLISTGTERLVARGEVPLDLHQAMRVAYMEGDFSFPIKYGYSLVGEVLSEGAQKGQIVHLMHPHEDRLLVHSAAITIVPTGIPPKRATLASNLETALNAVWDSKVSVGDRILVVGFGMIGSLVARLLSLMPAVEVFILEKNAYRQQLAQAMGFSLMTTHQRDFDLSFHTSANSTGLQAAIDAVGKEGNIIELSWYGNQKSSIALGGDFHYLRKRIISSQVGQIPTARSHRWDYQRRKALVLTLLENPVFDEHITHELLLEETPLFFQQLREGAISDGLGWVIKYE